MTRTKINVPRTAPAILFHSKESIRSAPPYCAIGARPRPSKDCGRHYKSAQLRHCGEASHKSRDSRLFPMKPIVLIPARMASTRLPGKPLADIAGVPMIVRVWRQAVAAEVGPVVVAAAEREIAAAIEAVGGRAVLTP